MAFSSRIQRIVRSRVRHGLAGLLLLQGNFARLEATTIVAIRTPTEVVIAADSAGVVQGDGQPERAESVCKIYQIQDKLFFGLSGLVKDPQSGFSVADIVAREGRASGTIAEKAERIEADVRAALLAELPNVRERDPDGYKKLVGSKGAVSVMLVGVEGDTPVAIGVSLGVAASAEGSPEITATTDSCPGNCPRGVRGLWIGEGAAIAQRLSNGGPPNMGNADLARFLVQLEIDAAAPSVGGPIDVLRILPSGPVWVRKKSACSVTLTGDPK